MAPQTKVAKVGADGSVQVSTLRLALGIVVTLCAGIGGVAASGIYVGSVSSHMSDTGLHESQDMKNRRIDNRIELRNAVLKQEHAEILRRLISIENQIKRLP